MAKGDMLNRKCKITFRQEIATDTFANQTINNVNPSLTDDKFIYFGDKMASILGSVSTDAIYRTNNYDIATE